MVLQNKHKAIAAYRYKKAHGLPTRSDERRPARKNLGSNTDRYEEQSEEELDEEELAALEKELQQEEEELARIREKSKGVERTYDESAEKQALDTDERFKSLTLNYKKTATKKVISRDELNRAEQLNGDIKRESELREFRRRLRNKIDADSDASPTISEEDVHANLLKLSHHDETPSSAKAAPKPVGFAISEEDESFLDSIL